MKKSSGIRRSLLGMLIMLACFAISGAVQSDIDCLKSIKESLEDPDQALSNWDFSNHTEGLIWSFTGVECWHADENKVLSIRLSGMGLKGPFPIGMKNCTSLTGFNLSNNHLTGHIPSNITELLQFVTSLDLSYNNLSGPIPPSIGNLTFINVLMLNNNQFTGQIPPELSNLDRIKNLNVANNRLSGQIPLFRNVSISEDSFANNLRLCGDPLSPCPSSQRKNEKDMDIFFFGFAVGFPVSTILTVFLMLTCFPGFSMRNLRSDLIIMIKNMKGRKHQFISPIFQIEFTDNSSEESKITAMEKYVRRLDLVELKLGTNDFDTKKVIGYGSMGLMYKAVFPSGLTLAVKRLHKFESFEKEFLLEIEILGRLQHINVVPLLCFCFEAEKKFLAYKFMSNGTLHQWIHSRPQVEGMKMGWSLRLRVAIGIARGLAWLHYNNTLRVAHLNITSNCILLDDKFEPNISNFSNSILMNSASGHTFFVPDSSPGPYKEDVYSFGILLLELVSGREWSCAEMSYVGDNVRGYQEFSMIDECLMGQGFDEEVYETLKIVENCVRTNKDGAATSMLQVYQAIRAVGVSRNKISGDYDVDLEDN